MRRSTATRTAVVLFAASLVLASCGDDDVTVADVTEEPGIPPEMESYDIDGADQYLGQRVTVESEVSGQIDERTFYIEDDGGNGLLIYANEPIVDQLDEDTIVRVTGTVVEVDLEDEQFGSRHALEDSDVEIIGSAGS